MKAEAALMLLPVAVCLLYGENILSFIVTIAALLIIGFMASYKKPSNTVIYAKEGFVIVALSWIVMSVFGAMPFYLSGAIPSYVNAFFETVSGFTTTGASILTDIESLPKGILFWRSFTHWIGGMGVLVFVLAIIPLAGERSIYLMRAEMPGPQVGKLVPKVRHTALILYGIYIALTLIEIIFLCAGGMPLFDSTVNTFATAGTGGFSIKNASIAAYDSVYVDVVLSVFMVIFGINFNLLFFLVIGKFKTVLKNEELRVYLGIITAAIIIITFNNLGLYENFAESLRYASFQVCSIITTTGFITADYDLWPELSRIISILLMFAGACAGSTGGGIKTSRIVIMFKSVSREIQKILHPKLVRHIRLDGKTVDEETVRGVSMYFMIYCMIMCIMVVLISLDGYDFQTTVSSVITCINNVGPGLGLCGPTGNFSEFSYLSKVVLAFGMLIGRLEIFPVIMLFSPCVWKRKAKKPEVTETESGNI